MRALAGIDVNGLWDHAAAWDSEEESVQLKDAGIDGAVISLACQPDTLIGGRQATLAPHGRGPGWGIQLGGAERRIRVHRILAGLSAGTESPRERSALVALVDGLAGDASSVVFATPDVPSFPEAARDRLLRTLKVRASRVTLLWRPIAAILGWLAAMKAEAGLQEGCRITVVSLMRDETHVADARLIPHTTPERVLWVPERSRAGVVAGRGGILGLAEVVAHAVADAIDMKPSEILEQARLPWEHAVGQPKPSELVRLWNRSWARMLDPGPLEPPRPELLPADHPARLRLAEANVILVEGPVSGNEAWVRTSLAALGLGSNDSRVHCLRPAESALGCLEAARRMDQGEPAYFDFLPQIEINALVRGEPAFVPLIPRGARVAGGQIYKSRAAADFGIAAGTDALTFYLLKESNASAGDFEAPRRADVTLSEAADSNHPIAVTVEQAPGQGFASVRIVSDTFGPLRNNPVQLDWSRMELVAEGRETLLANLKARTRSAYPNIAVIPGHSIFWHPDRPGGALHDLLDAYLSLPLIRRGRIDDEAHACLSTLRTGMSKGGSPRFFGRSLGLTIEETSSRHAVGADGNLPESIPHLSVPPGTGLLLDQALQKTAMEFQHVADLHGVMSDQALLGDLAGFATWCYRRCPVPLTRSLLDIHAGWSPLPLNPILLVEGLGRTICELADVTRFFDQLGRRLQSGVGLRQSEYAALSRILGGIEQAGERLSPDLARACLKAAGELIRSENRAGLAQAYKSKFRSALLMLSALLRHRQRDPDFATPTSHEGDALLTSLQIAETRIQTSAEQAEEAARSQIARRTATRLRRLEAIVEELQYFVRLEGRDPNIIRKIEDLSDE